MCLAIPAKILSIDGKVAICQLGGVRIKANLSFVEGVDIGCWVLVHAGCAIAVLTEKEASETFEMLDEVFGKEK